MVRFNSFRIHLVCASIGIALLLNADTSFSQQVKTSALYQPLTLKGHTDVVTAIAYSPKGQHIASASYDGTVRIWDSQTGKLIGQLKGHDGKVQSVVFTADGNRIVTGSDDKTVRVWDARNYVQLKALEQDASVGPVAVSPDGKAIAIGLYDDDDTVLVREMESGAKLAAMKRHYRGIRSLVYAPDGKSIVSASFDGDSYIWNPDTDEVTAHLEGPWAGGMSVNSVACSPDGRWIAQGCGGSRVNGIRIWNALNGKRRLSVNFDYVHEIAISPNGTRLATVSDDKTLRLWDAQDCRQLAIIAKHNDNLTSVSFHPQGGQIAAGTRDNKILVWNVELFDSAPKFKVASDSINAVVAADGKTILGANGNNLVLWQGQRPIFLAGHTDVIRSIAISPNGKLCASASDDKTVRLWNAENQQQVAVLSGHRGAVRSVAFSPDGKRIVSGGWDETVRVWSVADGAAVGSLQGHTNEITCVRFSPDGLWIASGSSDDTLRLWDAASLQEHQVLKDASSDITAIVFSPDARHLFVGAADTVQVWDLEGAAKPKSFSTRSSVNCMAISPDGSLLLTGSDDGEIRLWDTTNCDLLATLNGHTDDVISVMFSPDGKQIVSGSVDCTVRISGNIRSSVPLVYNAQTENLAQAEKVLSAPQPSRGQPERQSQPLQNRRRPRASDSVQALPSGSKKNPDLAQDGSPGGSASPGQSGQRQRVVNYSGQWRSERMWFTLQQSTHGTVTGRFGRPNQPQIGQISGRLDGDKLRTAFRTPGGNGEFEWQLSADSTAIVRWRKSSSNHHGWDGQHIVTRYPNRQDRNNASISQPRNAPTRR